MLSTGGGGLEGRGGGGLLGRGGKKKGLTLKKNYIKNPI